MYLKEARTILAYVEPAVKSESGAGSDWVDLLVVML